VARADLEVNVDYVAGILAMCILIAALVTLTAIIVTFS
jgi:hypothetical protein